MAQTSAAQNKLHYTSGLTSNSAIPPFAVTATHQTSGLMTVGPFDGIFQDDLDPFVTPNQTDIILGQSMFESSWPASPDVNFTEHVESTPVTDTNVVGLSTIPQHAIEDDPIFLIPSSTDIIPPAHSNHEHPQATTEHNSQLLPSLKPKPPGHAMQSSAHTETPEPSGRRMAHNLVERKYRDTLNGELERLRHAVPSIRNLDSETPDGRPRASKATVLSAATEYIKNLEREVERLTAGMEGPDEQSGRSPRRRRHCN